MSVSGELGEVREVELPQGRVRYRERGRGEPIVFVHGVGVNGDLWRKVVPRLAAGHRCIAPDWPFGSHDVPLRRDADLSPPGVARLIAGFLAALDLREVTLVGNDTGGGFAQMVAAHQPARLGRLVLTDCDAFENFPPGWTGPVTKLGYVPGAMRAFALLLRPHPVKRLFARPVTKRGFPPEIGRSYVTHTRPAGVYRDAAKVVRTLHPSHTLEAAARLRGFERPALVLWAPEDRFFPYEHGWRLASMLPDARLVDVHDSRAFVAEDQPERTAEAIDRFVRETPARAAAAA